MSHVAEAYLGRYARVYAWQGLGIATGFLSMFVVLPQLSSRPAIFGIYSVCLSLTILMTYSDLGFVSSGFRYASASFVSGDLTREIRTVGFVGFILLVFCAVQMAVVGVFAADPTRLIAELAQPEERRIASQLLIILAAFSPVVVLQRVQQIVFGIRIEDYVYQRVNIAANLCKIASVFVFFDDRGYDIVGYFLTSQLLGLAASLISLGIARRRYGYDLALLLRSFRFSSDIFSATRRLALSAVFMTLAWVVYYEFDSLFLGKALGATALASYAVGLSLATFARSMSSAFFAPFRARVNHFVASGDVQKLRSLYLRVLVVMLPLTVFPIVSSVALMEPLVLSWVGVDYVGSILVAQLLLLAYADAFNSYPASFVLMAEERVREINVLAVIAPAIFWSGVAVMLGWGALTVQGFAIVKLVAGLPVMAYSFVVGARCVGMGAGEFLRRVVIPAVPPVGVLILLLWGVVADLPAEKGHWNVAVVVATGGAASFVATLVYYLTASQFRTEVAAVATALPWRRSATLGDA